MSAETKSIWILVVAFIVGLGFLSYVRYEPIDSSAAVEYGVVLRHERGGSGKSSPNPHFIVELVDGREVKVRDSGEYPATYRGKVGVYSGEGVTTGREVYVFAR